MKHSPFRRLAAAALLCPALLLSSIFAASPAPSSTPRPVSSVRTSYPASSAKVRPQSEPVFIYSCDPASSLRIQGDGCVITVNDGRSDGVRFSPERPKVGGDLVLTITPPQGYYFDDLHASGADSVRKEGENSFRICGLSSYCNIEIHYYSLPGTSLPAALSEILYGSGNTVSRPLSSAQTNGAATSGSRFTEVPDTGAQAKALWLQVGLLALSGAGALTFSSRSKRRSRKSENK